MSPWWQGFAVGAFVVGVPLLVMLGWLYREYAEYIGEALGREARVSSVPPQVDAKMRAAIQRQVAR